MTAELLAMNARVIDEFRANDGKCGPPFDQVPMALVTMVGAKSGRELCSPLAYTTDFFIPFDFFRMYNTF